MFSFFENQISKWRSFEKKATNFSHFLVIRESYKNSFSTYLNHIHTCILLTLLTFLPYQFWNKYEFIRYGFSLVWFLVLILILAILEESINNKMVSKFKLECLGLLLIRIYTNAKFIVICKPLTLNDGGENPVKYRNRKKALLLSSCSHFAFYR